MWTNNKEHTLHEHLIRRQPSAKSVFALSVKFSELYANVRHQFRHFGKVNDACSLNIRKVQKIKF